MTRLLVMACLVGAIGLPTAASAQRPIVAGETVSGALTSGDKRLTSGAHYDLWVYSGTRGERVVITVRSIQFDAYVLVQRYPGGTAPMLARDDDGAGGNDARVELTLPETEEYVIAVTSAQRGEAGAYRVSVESEIRVARAPTMAVPVVPAVLAVTSDKPASAAKRTPLDSRVLVSGRTVAGELRSEVRGPIGRSEGDWRFTGRSGETITIDLRSSEFDPFLTLYAIDGRGGATRVAQDDNGGDGLNSRITYRISAAGEYVMRAERRYSGRSGSYTLALRSSSLAARFGLRAEGGATIVGNTAVSAELTDADPKMRDGTPYDLWKYVGRAGETIRVTLRSDDFDAFVSIGTVTNGVFTAIASADDGAGGTHSRLDFTLPFAGEFVIRANSLSPRTPTGDYVLRLDSFR